MDCKKYQVRSQAVTVLTEERFILSGDGSSQNIARQGKKNNNKKKQTFLQRHIIPQFLCKSQVSEVVKHIANLYALRKKVYVRVVI